MAETGEKLYKMGEVAAILRVHPNTIRRWDRLGKIKVVRAKGGHRRIPESEINRIAHQTPTAMTPATRPALSRDEELAAFLNFVFSHYRDDWDLVRRAIIVRDNYTCQECGGQEMIAVHHKDGTSRNELENLTTLCQKCHGKIHHQAIPWFKEQEKEATQEAPPQKIEKKIEAGAPEPAIKEEVPPPKPAPEKPKKPVIPGEATRFAILDAMEPSGLALRSAFGDLLSAAILLKKFATNDLTARARCPESVAKLFCEKLTAIGYLANKDGMFELQVEVTR